MTQPTSGSSAGTPGEIIHGALHLVRAEVKLGLAHALAFAVQAGLVLMLGLFSAVMLQSALILTVLSPLLFERLSVPAAMAALAAPYLAAFIGGGYAYMKWRKACLPAPSSQQHSTLSTLASEER